MDEAPSWVAAGLPPRVLAAGWQRTYADAVHATEMGAGNFRTRLKSLMAPENAQAQIVGDVALIARFQRFFRETTRRGALPFWIPDQIMDGQVITTATGAPITTRGGAPITITARWLAMFTPGSPPRDAENDGPYLRLSFALTILP